MDIISQAGQNKTIPVDMLCSAMHIPRATYYRHVESRKYAQKDQMPSNIPVNALNEQEKQYVLDLLHSERFTRSSSFFSFPLKKRHANLASI